MKRIILASASPRRKELLAQAGFSFEVLVSGVLEVITKSIPHEVVEELALQKGQAAAEMISGDAMIIGADTIVCLDSRILGKPSDQEEAIEMLRQLQGNTHQVYTGVTLVDREQGQESVRTFHEKTSVTMYSMSEEEILSYVETGEPMDKAGAYGIQGRAAVFIKEIKGDYNNVVGLPIGRLYQHLKEIKSV